MKKLEHPIYVTQPTLPDLTEFNVLLKEIWNNKILTNNGPFHKEFEKKLADFLGVKFISLFTNGTIGLITALQTLKVTGDVITTPYSFVASTHALKWNEINPIFCDVDKYGNIDAEKIEELITPQTTAILPVHVYGTPNDVNKIHEIASTYDLKVIYDAAHAFGVEINNESILNHGDLSVLSFHATKAFNTIEGGAIICHDEKTKKRIDYLKNFGFAGETTVVAAGINGKMNELQASYGLLQLKIFNTSLTKREKINSLYKNELKNIAGINYLESKENVKSNFSYFPIFVTNVFPITRDELYQLLKEHNVFARRYFYPLISDFPTYKHLPSAKSELLVNASTLSNQVICLPFYENIPEDIVKYIVSIIKNVSTANE